MDQLVTGGGVRRGMLGVSVQNVTSDVAKSLGLDKVAGALISAVTPGSPADKAGVKRGDVVTELDGVAVTDSNNLRNHVARTQPGSTVKLKVLRDGQEHILTAKLSELAVAGKDGDEPAQGGAERGAFGLSVQPLTPELAERLGVSGATGLAVTGVDPSGAAASAGIRQGDVIEDYSFLNAFTNSRRSMGLLLLMAPVRKSFGPGVCLPFQTSRNISFDALKKQSASFSGLPGVTSQVSLPSATVHFSSSPSEK